MSRICEDCKKEFSEHKDEYPVCDACIIAQDEMQVKCKICGCPGKDTEFCCSIDRKTRKHFDHICRTCREWEREQQYIQDGEISTSLWMEASLRMHRTEISETNRDPRRKYLYGKIMAEMEEIGKLVKEEFEPKFWFGKIKPILDDDSIRVNGLTGEFGSLKVVAGSMAGRGMVTFSDKFHKGHKESKYGGAYFTVITDDSSMKPVMGIQGLCATKDEAERLLKDAMAHWDKLKMKPDGVTIG